MDTAVDTYLSRCGGSFRMAVEGVSRISEMKMGC